MEMPQITRKVLTHPEDGEPITAEDWAAAMKNAQNPN